MARPRTIDDAVILRAARELFLRKGASLTTAEVAKKAGVAQGTLFKRYKTKGALFRAAMQTEAMPWMGSVERDAAKNLPKALRTLGHALVAFGRTAVPILIMSWSNRDTLGVEKPGPDGRIPFRPVQDLRQFFETQAKAGRLRVANPTVLAGAFFGAMLNYALVELLLEGHPVPESEFIRAYVKMLWEGVEP
jgi:AcrR family transcriptional regulator